MRHRRSMHSSTIPIFFFCFLLISFLRMKIYDYFALDSSHQFSLYLFIVCVSIYFHARGPYTGQSLYNTHMCQCTHMLRYCRRSLTHAAHSHRHRQPNIFLRMALCDKSAADENKNDKFLIRIALQSTYENESLRHSSILMISSILAAALKIRSEFFCIVCCVSLTVHTFTLFCLPKHHTKIFNVFPFTQYSERCFCRTILSNSIIHRSEIRLGPIKKMYLEIQRFGDKNTTMNHFVAHTHGKTKTEKSKTPKMQQNETSFSFIVRSSLWVR